MNMKSTARRSFLAAVCALVVALAVSLPALYAAPGGGGPNKTSKQVRLACKNGWRGSAVGEYGGVPVSIGCNNGRATQRLDMTAGTAYSIRMGAESQTVAIDCLFTGDAPRVNESCGEVRLTIR